MKLKANITAPQISERTSYDSMSLTIKYPSGAQFKYKINRSGETIEMAFSNDRAILKQQMLEANAWIKGIVGNNSERMAHVKAVIGTAKSGAEAMELIRADVKK